MTLLERECMSGGTPLGRRKAMCRCWTLDGYVANLLYLKVPVLCG